jgi:hypothetical protein
MQGKLSNIFHTIPFLPICKGQAKEVAVKYIRQGLHDSWLLQTLGLIGYQLQLDEDVLEVSGTERHLVRWLSSF